MKPKWLQITQLPLSVRESGPVGICVLGKRVCKSFVSLDTNNAERLLLRFKELSNRWR